MRVTSENQHLGIDALVAIEPSFRTVLDLYGPPPLWSRTPEFGTLVRIILEQQVSLASARAAFYRLLEKTGELSPTNFLQLGDDELKRIGFSRQKTGYARNLATALERGDITLDNFEGEDDQAVREQLTQIKGIGVWTANIYLLMALGRPDVWPSGDIALAAAYQQLKLLRQRPSNSEMDILSRRWKPYRAIAARLLYHFYLSEKDPKKKNKIQMKLKSSPQEYGLPPRTILQQLAGNGIAIIVDRKSRIIMADGKKLLEKFDRLAKFHPESQLVLKTSAPVCSKTRTFLENHNIQVTEI